MADEDRGLTLDKLTEFLEDFFFGFGIKGSGEALLTPLELADRDRLFQQALEESEKTRLATEEALSISEQSNRQLREKLKEETYPYQYLNEEYHPIDNASHERID